MLGIHRYLPLGLGFILLLRSIDCQTNSGCTANERKIMDPDENPYPNRKDWKQRWHPLTDERDKFVDLVFVVDGSGSITSENLDDIMKWIGSMSRGFDISTGKFQIGVVQYSHWYRTRKTTNQPLIRTELTLGSCMDVDCLEKRLGNVEYMGYTTYTGYALNKTVKEDFRNSKNYHKSTKILVLLTDGTSQDSVTESANYARQENVIIFAVGIGTGADINELRAIATGDPFEYLRVYLLPDFDQLQMITSSLENEIRSYYIHYVCSPLPVPVHGSMECTKANEVGSVCTVKCDYGDLKLFGSDTNACHVWGGIDWSRDAAMCGVCTEKFDLLIILDSSSSVTRERFVVAKKFVIALVDAMRIGKDYVQVSCLRYYSTVELEFNYDNHTAKQELQQAFRNIKYCGTGTNTGRALQYAVNRQFSTGSGRRKNVPHITLLITDGKAKDDVVAPAAELRKISVIYAIGLRGAKIDDIRKISSHTHIPELDRIIPDYKDLLNTTLVRRLLQSWCNSADEVRRTFCDKTELPGNVTCDGDEAIDKRKPVGTMCALPCAVGYRTQRESSALCAYDGNWALTNFKCIEKDCEPPTENDAIVPLCNHSFKIASLCNLHCKPGYDIIPPPDQSNCEMFGNRTISCFLTCKRTESGNPKWDSDPIGCKKTDVCREHSCGKGQCIRKEDGEFYCHCDPGYNGVFCESEINECADKDCHNGTCRDKINGYQCICSHGFGGIHCEININECTSNPCQNRGKCNDKINGYSCECLNGFIGDTCGEEIDECASNPCQNNATCKDGTGDFKCECMKGFNGNLCQENIDDCANDVCNKIGTRKCVDQIASYQCKCRPGWTGTACHIDRDECKESNPCINGGKCSNTEGSYSCICKVGYEGHNCGKQIDYCEDRLCTNGGICRNYIGSYVCECPTGYSGQHCKANINDCKNNKCEKGVCIDGVNDYTCDCQPGYFGKFCQNDTNECDPNPCENGHCKEDKPNSYRCQCIAGFTGKHCEKKIDQCEFISCQNNGTCSDLGVGFECECHEGFHGRFCGHDVNECEMPENNCNERGECRNTHGGFYCKCEPGFDGDSCDRNINECENHGCKNSGKCIDEVNGYTCACVDGFTGDFCETDVDDCAPNPCVNNGTCRDLINNYVCECLSGYAGQNCEILNDACLSNPCQNSAICITLDTGYRCDCLHGYAGIHCGEDIDECKTEPPICNNEGTCINEEGSFKCQCKSGYDGPLCDIKLCDHLKQNSSDGEMVCTNGNHPGSQCVISCPKGMRLTDYTQILRVKPVAKLQLTCTENATWNNSGTHILQPTREWQCEMITCDPLQQLSIGGYLPFQQVTSSTRLDEKAHHINCTNGENVGSLCRLRCHKYYTLQGNLWRKCSSSGSWTGSRWRCAQRRCPDKLPPVRNGTYVCGDNSRPGSVCNVICNPGFVRDEEKLGRVICDDVNGQMTWKRVGTRGTMCRSSECEASLNLATLDFDESSLLSVRRFPYRDIQSRQYNKEGRSVCNAKAILAINITRRDMVTVQFWYGDVVAGYHTVFSTNETTNGHDTHRPSNEFLISGVGRHLSSSGFGDRTARPKKRLTTVNILPAIVVPNSRASMTFTFDRWWWNSTSGNWKGDLLHEASPQQNTMHWYMIYLGLNRVPNMQPYYNHYRNGTGLCHICFIKN